ncbi:MAG: hypothetical protein Q7S57_00395 [bacterium]|nr:hypothetical protein [bacterium]
MSAINEIDYFPAIHGITRQSIGVPRQNSACFTFLDTFQHFPEDRSARNFGRLFFDKLLNDI